MVGPMPPDTLNPKYPPRTEHRPAIAVLDVFIVAWTRPDGLVGLLVAKSSEPDFVNQLTLEVRSRTGVNMTTFQGHVLFTWAGDDQQPGGCVLRLPRPHHKRRQDRPSAEPSLEQPACCDQATPPPAAPTI
jgi:hypothetical protein